MKATLYPPRRGKTRQVEIAPNQLVLDLEPKDVARIVVADLIPQGDHTYRAVARVHQTDMRLTPDLLRELKIGVPYATMRRLIRAGFVEGTRVAPNSYVFCLESYYAHKEKVKATYAEGKEFWSGDNLDRYRTAI